MSIYENKIHMKKTSPTVCMYIYIYIYKDIYLFIYLFIYLYPDETVPQRKPQGYISRIYSLGRGSIFPFDV